MTSALALTSTRRHPLREKRRDQLGLFIALALLAAVLIADAVLIALGAGSISDIAALYGPTT